MYKDGLKCGTPDSLFTPLARCLGLFLLCVRRAGSRRQGTSLPCTSLPHSVPLVLQCQLRLKLHLLLDRLQTAKRRGYSTVRLLCHGNSKGEYDKFARDPQGFRRHFAVGRSVLRYLPGRTRYHFQVLQLRGYYQVLQLRGYYQPEKKHLPRRHNDFDVIADPGRSWLRSVHPLQGQRQHPGFTDDYTRRRVFGLRPGADLATGSRRRRREGQEAQDCLESPIVPLSSRLHPTPGKAAAEDELPAFATRKKAELIVTNGQTWVGGFHQNRSIPSFLHDTDNIPIHRKVLNDRAWTVSRSS